MSISDQMIKRLTHLAGILQNMDDSNAKEIIAGMENNIRLNGEAMQFLIMKLFDPGQIFNDLAKDEIVLLLKSIEMPALAGLIKMLDNDLEERCKSFIGKNKYEDVLAYEGEVSREIIFNEFFNKLGHHISRGEIAYNGTALMFSVPPCRPGGEKARKKKNIFFQILNPILSPGEGLRLIIFASGSPNDKVRISLQGTGKRFFDKNLFYTDILLGNNGFYYGDVFPDYKEGPVTVWLEIPGVGEVRRTLFFAKESKSVFAVYPGEVSSQPGGKKSIAFTLHGKSKSVFAESAYVKIYCGRCGVPLSIGICNLSEGRGDFEFIMPETNPLHSGDVYFHVTAGEHQAGAYLDLNSGQPPAVILSEDRDRNAGDIIAVNLNADDYDTIFYHVTTSSLHDSTLRNYMHGGILPVEGVHKSSGKRKSSPLELSILMDELMIFSDFKGRVTFGNFLKIGPFYYKHNGIENINDLYFTFYKITEKGIEPLSRHISYLKKEPQIFPVLPKFLGEGESVEIDIGYFLPNEGTITLMNGSSLSKDLNGRGKISQMLEYGSSFEMKLETDGHPDIKKIIDTSEMSRVLVTESITYVPPGSSIQHSDLMEFEIFNNPDDIFHYIIENFVFNYPFD